jgi:hypothetical protein
MIFAYNLGGLIDAQFRLIADAPRADAGSNCLNLKAVIAIKLVAAPRYHWAYSDAASQPTLGHAPLGSFKYAGPATAASTPMHPPYCLT